jgi:hypothetical protein
VSIPQRGSIFFHDNMNNLFLRRDEVPAVKTQYERSSAKIAGNLRLRIGTAGIENSDVF